MRVLVTGGAGFIGSAVTRLLNGGGDEVHMIVRPATAAHRLLELPATEHRIDLADLTSVSRTIAAVRPDVVVNTAASSGHPGSGAERIDAWRDDVLATVALFEALRDTPPLRLVHMCSSLVYRPSTKPLGEDAAIDPETPRGVSKLAATTAVTQWSRDTGIPAVIIRPFSVYGEGQNPARVIPTLLRALKTGKAFAVTASEARRDFVHVDDVAGCVALAAVTGAADAAVLNVGTGAETSIPDLVTTAEWVTGATVVPATDPHPGTPPRREHWLADPSLAAELLGWRSSITLEEGLRMLWEGKQ